MSVQTVALIGGTGRLGVGLARRLAQAGMEVFIGSRTPTKAQEAAGRVRQGEVHGVANPDAARLAEVLVLTVPYAAHQSVLGTIEEGAAGKVVIDTTVPLVESTPVRVGRPPAGSAAQEAQQALPAARIVAGFHTVSADMLADLSRSLHGDVLLCGDDSPAKATVEGLVRAIGMRPVDTGALVHAQILEQLAGLVLALNRRYKRHDLGITVAGLDR